MTYELPISSAMYSTGGSAYVERALETNHHSRVREEKEESTDAFTRSLKDAAEVCMLMYS